MGWLLGPVLFHPSKQEQPHQQKGGAPSGVTRGELQRDARVPHVKRRKRGLLVLVCLVRNHHPPALPDGREVRDVAVAGNLVARVHNNHGLTMVQAASNESGDSDP